MNSPLIQLPVTTREGVFIAHYSETGLTGLDFPKLSKRIPSARISGGNPSKPMAGQIRRWHRATTAALKSILGGRAAKTFPPFDWSGKTKFQQAVWNEMLKLGPGETRSYGEIAEAIGKPKAVRAVGGACGANPVPIFVPCHRVLAANKKLGGFSGGLDWKRSLLMREGVMFR